MRWLELTTAFFLALTVACDDDDGMSDGETGGTCDAPPAVQVTNTVSNAIEELIFTACDMSDQVSYPVPMGALPPGEMLTASLPGPGCWIIEYRGEGCETNNPLMAEVEACDTVAWEPDEFNHGCVG